MSTLTPTIDLAPVYPNAARERIRTHVLHGERFVVHHIEGQWAYGQCEFDGCEGFIELSQFGPAVVSTHVVTSLLAPCVELPTVYEPVVRRLPMAAEVFVSDESGEFFRIGEQLWLYKEHVRPLGSVEPDHVATAARFMGTPFQWGGRSAFGFDCSGLIQLSLKRAGIVAPRSCREQGERLGSALAPGEELRRGDLFYFDTHSGIVWDDEHVLHCGGGGRTVRIQRFDEVYDRMVNKRHHKFLCHRRIEAIQPSPHDFNIARQNIGSP
jgi:hypothetical protein